MSEDRNLPEEILIGQAMGGNPILRNFCEALEAFKSFGDLSIFNDPMHVDSIRRTLGDAGVERYLEICARFLAAIETPALPSPTEGAD